MRKKHIFIVVLVWILFLSVACSKTDIPPITDNTETPIPTEPEKDPIDELLKSMSIEEKIGQLLIVGLEGTEISEADKLQIDKNKVGGFILFSRNIESKNQTLDLLNSLKEENMNNKVPLFLSVDEEGGRVSRLSKIYKNLLEASTLSDKMDNELSYEYGEILGVKLSRLGFNLNFAPVMDINSNEDNPVIGDRAYGNTAQEVVEIGLEVMKGLKTKNIIPVAKHFPGHGDTSIDSHLDLPIVDKSFEELLGQELIPFEAAIKNDIGMIMVAHILFPRIDSDNPSTMSNNIIEKILRDKLGYSGVVVSDDMTMGAIINNFTIEEAAMKFLKSGGDIALVCHGIENPSIVIERIKQGIDKNEISIEEIDKKVYRILKLKNQYKLEDMYINNVDIEDINMRTIDLNKKLS